MTQEAFVSLIERLDNNCKGIMQYKNDNVYAKGTEDRLHNFKVGAEISGMTPAQIAWGYMTKHTAALRDMVLSSDFDDLDELEEKCTDMINYIKFIYCLGVEYNHSRVKQGVQSTKYTTDSNNPQIAIPV